jgi:hypothetical protein
MKLSNRTKILDKHLQEIIQFTDPGVRKGHFVHVRPSRFHPKGYAMVGAKQKTIYIWVPKELKYPFAWGYHHQFCVLDDPILDEDENLVFMLAHELRHRWQSEHPSRRYGSRVTQEIDADAYAWHKVRAWRRLTRASHPQDCYPKGWTMWLYLSTTTGLIVSELPSTMR